MHRSLIILLILPIAFTGCNKSEKAQQELARSNINYTESDFIENARQGNVDAVKLFLDAGMNTEVKTRDGQTPLMVAALGNQIDVVKLLLENGADVNARNKFDGT